MAFILRGHHILGHPIHFVGELFVVQRIKLQSHVVNFQIERTLMAGSAGHRNAQTFDFVERYARLFVLDATLGSQEEFRKRNLRTKKLNFNLKKKQQYNVNQSYSRRLPMRSTACVKHIVVDIEPPDVKVSFRGQI